MNQQRISSRSSRGQSYLPLVWSGQRRLEPTDFADISDVPVALRDVD
jgi:hypothetical protein